MFPSDQDEWNPAGDKQKQLMAFLSNNFQTPSGQATPPAASGLPPAPPSDSKVTAPQQEKVGQDAKDLADISASGFGLGADPEAIQAGLDEQKNNEKVSDSHPGLQPDDLTNYIKGQETQLDKFGPEKQAQVMQSLQKGYQSPGNVLAKGGATLADAIMQGVARAGSSGNLAAIDQREQQNLQRAAETGKNLNEQNQQGVKEKMALEQMTGKSPLGSSYIASLEPLVRKLYPNLTDEQWGKISSNPTALQAMLGPSVDMKKVEGELAMRDAMLGATSEHYRAEARNQEAQRKEEDLKSRIDTLKETAKHTVLHPFEAAKAAKELARLGQGSESSFAPDVLSYAQKHGITPEQAQEQKNRRMGGK